MEALLAKSTMPNLLDDHPPFQIDGNFGASSGVLECLVQSHLDGNVAVIELLPACTWVAGSLRGVCAIGGWSLEFRWEGSRLEMVTARCDPGALTRMAHIHHAGKRVVVEGVGEHTVEF
jgi:hypothetical protein